MSAEHDAMAPDWVEVLRLKAAQTSIAEAARSIGYSRTAVSLVLSGKYPGDTRLIKAAVIDKLAECVNCPGLGRTIPINECREWAGRPFTSTNPMRVQMYQACRACPNRPEGGTNGQ